MVPVDNVTNATIPRNEILKNMFDSPMCVETLAATCGRACQSEHTGSSGINTCEDVLACEPDPQLPCPWFCIMWMDSSPGFDIYTDPREFFAHPLPREVPNRARAMWGGAEWQFDDEQRWKGKDGNFLI